MYLKMSLRTTKRTQGRASTGAWALGRVGGGRHHCGGQGLRFAHVEVGIRQRRGPSDQTLGSGEAKVAGNVLESPSHTDRAKEPHKPLRREFGGEDTSHSWRPSRAEEESPLRTRPQQAGWGSGGGGTVSLDKGEYLHGDGTSRRVGWSAVLGGTLMDLARTRDVGPRGNKCRSV